MSRINTNVQSLIAQRVLGENNSSLNTTLERLSTGLRINRGKDDPAGLIASENLKAEITSINAAISNNERADQVVNIAEGGLNEISNSLNELQGLLTASASTAGLSTAEKEANQLQIDSILQTVDRIAGATSFQGIKLLNGNFEFETSSVSSGVTDFRINAAKFNAASQSVGVNVTQSAQQGGVYLSLGGATIELDQAGSFTLEIGGSLGSREVTFASGATIADVAAAINTFSDITGVFASGGTTGVSLYSSEYGSQEFVSVRNTGDAVTNPANTGLYNFSATDQFTINTTIASTFAASGTNPVRDAGQDVGGTINGIQATGDGLNLRANTDFLDVELTLGTAGSGLSSQVLGNNNAFDITGGGATFQLAGTVDIAGRVGVGISDVASRKLGTSALGFLDELGNGRTYNVVTGTNAQLATAQKIVSSSIEQVSATRGRLGAFQRNVIGATTRSLGVAVENTAAANSVIADADFAAETAQLTRSQILVQAATNTLSLANQNPQSALSLLG